jgi:hypothetical protein
MLEKFFAYFQRKVEIEYNGRTYSLKIPELRGTGKLWFVNKGKIQKSGKEGIVYGARISQSGNEFYINNTSIERLVLEQEQSKH